MGIVIKMESYMSDYTENDSMAISMKTLAKDNGMESAVISFDKVKVNIPIEDGVFSIK